MHLRFNGVPPRIRNFSDRRRRVMRNRFEKKRIAVLGGIDGVEEVLKSTVDKLLESMTPEERLEFDREYQELLAEERKLEREYEARIANNSEQVSAEKLPDSDP